MQWSVHARTVLVKSWTLMNQHQTILHGDSRIGNMMFPSAPGRGRFVLIDWQATRQGKAAFDLAYFLVLSLMTTHRHELERPAVDKYYGQLIAKGVKGYTREEFEDDYRHGCLCTLVLLSLPMLSGEVSADGEAALLFVFGMGIWRERLRQYFLDFDYVWMAGRYALAEQECRDAIAEMIAVIDARLNGVLTSVGSKDTLIDVLRRSNVAGEFDV
jgi:thiamine kinase-like enzyme